MVTTYTRDIISQHNDQGYNIDYYCDIPNKSNKTNMNQKENKSVE